MKHFRILLPLLSLAVLFAGCGGSSAPKVQPGDIAEVGGEHVTLSQYQSALAEAQASAKAQGQAVPTAGSTAYATMKTGVVNQLVQQAELEAQAQKLGVSVSASEIAKQLALLKKNNFKGSEKAYQAALKSQHVTDAQIREYIKEQLLDQKIYKAITKGTKVSKSAIAAYYAANAQQYQQAATRSVEEILVGKNKSLANKLYGQLKGGGDFAALAKQYSKDPGSKDKGGKYTATQGSDVPEFDAAVFAKTAKNNVLLHPVNTSQYGWFLIEPLASISPGKTTPESKAAPSIRKQLLTTKSQQVAASWMTTVAKSYCSGKISYQSGYTPSPDPCATLNSSVPTTT
jgi:parvulin-like peptidyl-prolyl isomerase